MLGEELIERVNGFLTVLIVELLKQLLETFKFSFQFLRFSK